jgi:TctA family transporter
MMIERFEAKCPYCSLPVPVEWETGVMMGDLLRAGLLPGPYTLVADWIFHDACWDKLVTEHPP